MIKEFQGEYRWLSNFAKVNIRLSGINYPSVEHAYMSAKSKDTGWKKFCMSCQDPGTVKRISKEIEVVSNWEDIKVTVMRECITQKFNQEPFKTLLLNTGTQHIQEGNRWGDKFWGVCLKTNRGQNILGTIIMDVRKELAK